MAPRAGAPTTTSRGLEARRVRPNRDRVLYRQRPHRVPREEQQSLFSYARGDPLSRRDPSGLADFFVLIDIDLVAIFGFEVSGGFVIDTDHLTESGYFVSAGPAAGANIGIGVGGGYASRDIEGEGIGVDLNVSSISPSVLFDDQGLNGFALTWGQGLGASWSRTRTWNLGIPVETWNPGLPSDLDQIGAFCPRR